MPRKLVTKSNFLGGEAGYLLKGRSDLPQFQVGASRLENLIPLKGGAATRRPGTRYVKNTLNNKPARLIEFVVSYDSGDDIYVLEISLQDSVTLAFRVIRVSDQTVFTPTGSPFTVPGFGAFFLESELSEIQYTQIGETMFIVHRKLDPLVFQRTAAQPDTFKVQPYIGYVSDSRGAWLSLPYRDVNVSPMTITPSGTTGSIALTSSVNFFDPGMIGSYYQINEGSGYGAVLITAYTDPKHLTGTVVVTLGGTSATTDWAEGAWSGYRGFPRTVALYNQRTIFGGNDSQPDTFWSSETANYFMMAATLNATVAADDPQQFTLASAKPNQIRWMVGGQKLTVGTSTSEWVGTFTESSDGSSTSVQFDEQTTHGSAPVQARRSGLGIPFVQRGGHMVREIVFDFYYDTYVATDLSLFASHIATAYGRFANATGTHIIQNAYQDAPGNIIWYIDNVGRLYGIVRDKEQQIAAWHSHTLGGRMTALLVDGAVGEDYSPFVTSICTAPDENGQLDRIWMVVNREINGASVYHVEYMDDIKSQPSVVAGTFGDIRAHLDCATLNTADVAAASWSGFDRFASTNAYVIAQDSSGVVFQAGLLPVDSGGIVTLSKAAVNVCVGLAPPMEMRFLPFEGGDNPQLYMRALKRVDSVAVRLYQTYGLNVGKDIIERKTGEEESNTFEPLVFDNSSGVPLKTFTGVKEFKPPTDVDHDGTFTFRMDEPWGCTILSVCARLVENEV